MLNSGLTYGANEDEWHSMLQALTLQDDRGSLPPLAKPFPAIQPWKVIKDAFGSDQLMAMPMPMQLHEPTSELTKRAEELAYASLLNQVSHCHRVKQMWPPLTLCVAVQQCCVLKCPAVYVSKLGPYSSP